MSIDMMQGSSLDCTAVDNPRSAGITQRLPLTAAQLLYKQRQLLFTLHLKGVS